MTVGPIVTNIFERLKDKCLLLIDDDELIRDSLYLFFDSEGCNILALESGEKGLQLAQRQRFDVIIVDFRLPGMDGIEFIRRLPPNQAPAFKILITAYGSRDIMTKAKKAGIHEILCKPFDSDSLEKTLARLLSLEAT
jgi:DNA-binding NtrC family response regulator